MIQDMMSGGASVEKTLDLWASGLRSAKERIVPLFTQKRVASSACAFLDVLIGNEPRKTGWMRAESAGDLGPWRQLALLGRGHWDADALRDVVRDYVIEHLGAVDGVLVIDETGFLKKGAGVLRCRAAVYGFCRQDHELPDWFICHLCLGTGPCLC